MIKFVHSARRKAEQPSTDTMRGADRSAPAKWLDSNRNSPNSDRRSPARLSRRARCDAQNRYSQHAAREILICAPAGGENTFYIFGM
jgi:hypothetical protein